MEEKRAQISPPSTNKSKIHLRVEQFSLKTYQKQKDPRTTKAVRRSTRNPVGREEKQLCQDPCPWEGTQKKREIAQADTCPGV